MREWASIPWFRGVALLAAACAEEPRGGRGGGGDGVPADPRPLDPSSTPAAVRPCPEPGRRAERAYDEVVLPGEAADERRFWGGGLVAADFDGDGDPDLLVPGPTTARYLRNDGGRFVDDPAVLPPGVDWTYAAGGAAADFDEDGDLDVVVTRWGPPDLLLINDGGRFGVTLLSPSPGHSQSAAWADLDGDGHLDLLVAGHGEAEVAEDQLRVTVPGDGTRLFRGTADGLREASERLGPDLTGGYTFVVGVTELDGDGVPDLLFANDYPWWLPGMGSLGRDGGFVRAPGRLGLSLYEAGMGLGIGDLDGDGVDDFVEPYWGGISLLRSSASGVWVEASAAAGLLVPEPPSGPGTDWVGWGADLADLDNDGDLDVIVAFGHLDPIAAFGPGRSLLDNPMDQRFGVYVQGEGGFSESARALSLDRPGAWRGFVTADLDGDGWLDLARRDLDGDLVIDLARCGTASWLRVVPEPPAAAVGAEVRVWTADRILSRTIRAGGHSLNSGGPPEAHFGLGAADRVLGVEVRWPDGEVTELGPRPARQVVHVRR